MKLIEVECAYCNNSVWLYEEEIRNVNIPICQECLASSCCADKVHIANSY